MYKFYEVDPDADTLLIIPHPSKQFAPWQQDNSPPTSPSSVQDASAAYAGILRGTSRPPNIYASIASSPETRIKVSSKHLSLVSKHFRNKFRYLAGQEDTQAAADGRFHVTLGGYDPAAVAIVMDIIHGRGRKVPKTVGLEMLAKVAVFVDAFRCFEAVEVYAERWFEKLLGGGDVPGGDYGRDSVLWIYASYVFRQSDVFRRATRTAVLDSDGLIRTLGLQVRAGVIKEIDIQRQQVVRKALDIVHGAVDAMQEDRLQCPQGCDTFILGALIKTLHRANLVWPRPSKPFAGISFTQIVEAVRQAQAQVAQFIIPGLSLNESRTSQHTSRKHKSPNAHPEQQALTPDSSPEALAASDVHECDAQSNLAEKLRELEAEVEGLELESKLGYYLY